MWQLISTAGDESDKMRLLQRRRRVLVSVGGDLYCSQMIDHFLDACYSSFGMRYEVFTAIVLCEILPHLCIMIERGKHN